MDVLLDEHAHLLTRKRVGLVCHPASTNRLDTHSAVLIREQVGERLTCLMGPEHGVYGAAAAGERVQTTTHPVWRIPVYSLYGDMEASLQAMVKRVDTVVFDLQDLAVRCYTYIYTLRAILETAHAHGLQVVVTDRPVPLASCVDGPMLDPAFQSVVAPVPAPLVYGMTPAETARWLCATLDLSVELTVVPLNHFTRGAIHAGCWPTWTPPSPAIRSWDCSVCFPITVFTEAFPQLDCARNTRMAFRVLRAEWLDAEALLEALHGRDMPGVMVARYHDVVEADTPGIQLRVIDIDRFRPAKTAVTLLHEIQRIHGVDVLWKDPRCKPAWFDRLMGTDRVRLQIMDGETPERIAREWQDQQKPFQSQRAEALLYDA